MRLARQNSHALAAIHVLFVCSTLGIAACSETTSPDAKSPDVTSASTDDSVEIGDIGICDTPSAYASCVKPDKSDEYYVEQANKYFDTLDGDAPVDSVPDYSEDVARWEWYPWLKLTGIGKTMMIGSDIMVTRFATPSTVPVRDCRFFETQPFARCKVQIQYEGGLCPIYEEFAFDAQGKMTFIEAWTDLPKWHPGQITTDPWAEAADIRRLSTKVPGLGYADAALDLSSPTMLAAAANDPDIADFARRAQNFWTTWAEEFSEEASLDSSDVYGYGCGWE